MDERKSKFGVLAEGYEARRLGETLDDNPYESFTGDYEDWSDGWWRSEDGVSLRSTSNPADLSS
ncbi:MAG: hypothetical protein ACD_75C00540G0008 [uncultured bacterium]|nr:MAG: hypothetical protein ACD_75C00540G0008 [uncultured bacterium]